MLLTGCASGSKDDARRAADEDATKGAVVPGAEATHIVAEYFAKTPSPVPTPTIAAELASLVLTSGVGQGGAPVDDLTSVFSAGRIYAAAQISHLVPGWTVQAVWRREDGQQVSESSVEVSNAVDPMWLSFAWDVPAGVPPGDYGVFIYVNGELLDSLAFRVG